jgi:hypothetical protein
MAFAFIQNKVELVQILRLETQLADFVDCQLHEIRGT